ncbi:hypothetical protein D7a_00076 [Klebsiella phage VLCpiD7a]|nr:hypothetical protein D7a_00076 [Klebsiella phage VLCpiD7a]
MVEAINKAPTDSFAGSNEPFEAAGDRGVIQATPPGGEPVLINANLQILPRLSEAHPQVFATLPRLIVSRFDEVVYLLRGLPGCPILAVAELVIASPRRLFGQGH